MASLSAPVAAAVFQRNDGDCRGLDGGERRRRRETTTVSDDGNERRRRRKAKTATT
jgi:hypothetical protein